MEMITKTYWLPNISISLSLPVFHATRREESSATKRGWAHAISEHLELGHARALTPSLAHRLDTDMV